MRVDIKSEGINFSKFLNSAVTDLQIIVLSKAVSGYWKQLAQTLRVSTDKDLQTSGNDESSKQALVTLQKWRRTSHVTATLRAFIKACDQIGLHGMKFKLLSMITPQHKFLLLKTKKGRP